MQNRGLKTLILTTALTPSLLIALALGTYFNKSRVDDIDHCCMQRSHATALQLANAARRALRDRRQRRTAGTESSRSHWRNPGVNSVAIFDASAASARTSRPAANGYDSLQR